MVQNIQAYKKKLFLNIFIRGSIFFVAISLCIYLVANSLEFSFRFSEAGRTAVFFMVSMAFITGLIVLVIVPLIRYFKSDSLLSNEEAAVHIGNYFPDLKDKLLNTIQLRNSGQDNALLNASVAQRTQALSIFTFSNSIDLKGNFRYFKYILIPFCIILLAFLFVPHFLTESTVRIINYDKEYNSSLFKIQLVNTELIAFRNEPYQIDFKVEGQAIPAYFYFESGNKRAKMNFDGENLSYQIAKVQDNFSFSISAGSFVSKTYNIKVKSRPEIKNLSILLDFPVYTGLESSQIINNGNITAPEGTIAKWSIESIESDQIQLVFERDSLNLTTDRNGVFKTQQKLNQETDYEIKLHNVYSQNKEIIVYHIDIIKDQYPQIKISTQQDTTLYKYLLINGIISDDYGFQKLQLVYDINGSTHKENINFNRKINSQNYYHQLSIDSLHLTLGDELSYYVSVFDNDAVNGPKESRTQKMLFKIPVKTEINKDIEKSASQAKKDIDKALDKAEDIKEKIAEIQKDFKKQNNNSWQEQKKLNKLLKDKTQLEQELQELAKKHKELTQKQNQFHKPNPELQKKAAELQKLMEDILDEETKKLYDELKKLLENEKTDTDLKDLMNNIQHKEKNLEKEIERALEMFKRMQFDYKMDEIINDLENLEKQQSKLAEDTQNKEKDLDSIKEEQSKLDEEFDRIQEQMDKMEEMNEELSQPEDLEDLSPEEESIDQAQEDAKKELEDNNRKKAGSSQKKAADQMQQLGQKMKEMQAGMEMEMLSENLDNLRDILDNLLKLSFDQESLMDDFTDVNQSDPRYVTLSQNQLKLRDDAVIIEDSLLSLAKRVFQIQSFVTRELNDMNKNIEASLQALKDRKKPEAVASQQYTMTAINNLSLLLNDVLQQMQQQMAEAMGSPQKGKKGPKNQSPSMSEMQKQLNEKINQLKKEGKSGRQLSQELAELAAEQEMLRQQLQEMQDGLNQGEEGVSKNLQEMIKKMEQTETDLVNKNLSQEMLRRQEEILTRMLQSEDALKERELDQKREAQSAKDLQHTPNKEFEEYIKAKESELELLQTLPAKMNPYYKEEVNKYFQRLNEQ
ncbi:hypothetical protein N6H18_05615 [Reichenbachiella agarivorans]|uniref:ATPase n=1 Tax=Reichenbachiella agarivorans TaxID=2979464 RepID=A0ABY6CVD2_9BACT|nr:DUF4175 family protein [Reichenbachiella agarivorans]UXP33428.1 hypothetical protein N6H18_05615 [Reichenbachiella agarivorans]